MAKVINDNITIKFTRAELKALLKMISGSSEHDRKKTLGLSDKESDLVCTIHDDIYVQQGS